MFCKTSRQQLCGNFTNMKDLPTNFLTESFLTRVSSSLNTLCRATMLTEKIPYFERKSKPSLCLDVFSIYVLSKRKVLSLAHFSPVLHFILKPVI